MFDNTFKNEFDNKIYNELKNESDKIKTKTASIILTNGVTAIERSFATKDPNTPKDSIPELTLEEAIQIGFKTTEKEGLLYWVDENNNKVPIYETAVEIYYDEKTAKEIQTQLNILNDNRVYNVTLISGMAITIKATNK
ncbi:hypothetical protein [Bacillus cereus]|uniref:Clostridial binary toxin B/anthrax toxin PA domain-containing protein n=1 Tax=Bacillus cereus TaxID=1396 RepID=A0A2A8ZPS9_BACCE|nr:hypothetical protein [Bacillus cereus]PFE05366.1 hypothetical protein CN307_33175 [Bacillus cereus]